MHLGFADLRALQILVGVELLNISLHRLTVVQTFCIVL